MGYSGGIASVKNPDFKLDMGDFKEALRKEWHDVQIKEVHEDDIDFGMTFKTGFESFAGSTIKQKQIGWWSGFEEFAEFIIWYRKYVPEDHELLAWCTDFYNYLT